MGGSSGGSGGGSTIDPGIRDAILSNYNFGVGLSNQPYQPYTGQTIATPSAAQTAAEQAGVGMYNTGAQALGTTLSNLGRVQAAQAPLVQAQQAYAPTGYTASSMNAAQASAPTTAYSGMGLYANPFENQVVQSSLNDLNSARMMALGQNADAATKARAFGGSRHGVADTLSNAAFAQQAANTAGQLRSQGFNTAAGLAGQDVSRGLELAGMNAQMRQQAGMANQAAYNQAAQFGVGAGMDLAQQNAQMRQQAGLANQASQQNQYQTALQAAGMTPQMIQSMYGNIGQLEAIGAGQTQRSQAQLDQAYQNFLEARSFPQQQLALRTSSLMGGFGGTYQPPTPVYRNQFGQMAGLAATGAGIGSMMAGSNPALMGPYAGYGAMAGLGLSLLGGR